MKNEDLYKNDVTLNPKKPNPMKFDKNCLNQYRTYVNIQVMILIINEAKFSGSVSGCHHHKVT